MTQVLSSSADPDPAASRSATIIPLLVVALTLAATTTWWAAFPTAVLGYTLIRWAFARWFRTRKISVMSDDTIRVTMDDEDQEFAIREIVKIDSTGEFRPGPRITIHFSGGREIAGLIPSDSGPTLKVIGRRLEILGLSGVVEPPAWKHVMPSE